MSGKKEKTNICLIGELLDSANALPRRLNDVETLRFSLQELKQRSMELNTTNGSSMTKAHYLLMNSGINVEDIMRKLDKLSQVQTQIQVQQQQQKPKSNAVLDSSISNVIMDSDDDSNFNDFVNSNIQMDWKVRKREMRDKFNGILKRDSSVSIEKDDSTLKKPKDLMMKQLTWGNRNNKSLISSNFKFIDIDETSNNGNSLGNNPSPQISIKLRKKFESYAQIIHSLNDAREKKENFPLCQSFIDLNKRNKTGTNEQFIESLEIIKNICETNQEDKFNGSLGEAYKSENLNEFNSIKLRNFYVKKSKCYLESQFNKFVNDLYMKSLHGQQVRTNKSISIIDKIMNFINLTLKEGGNENNGNIVESGKYKIPFISIINGTPIWAVLFYCIRGGFKQEAIEFLKLYEDSFNKIEKFFPIYLKEYLTNDCKLSAKNWGRMNNEFNQYFKLSNEIDPFKIGIYKLIGKLDLSKKSVQHLPLSIEDWVWFQLSLINENDFNNGDEEILNERYSLLDLQRNILEFGEKSFNSSNLNPVYLQTLVLVGLNEEAIKYYFKVDEIDSIHLAILFDYYGILRTNNGMNNYKLLNKSVDGFIGINFNQLLGYYIKFFKFSDPVVSAEYIFLMNDSNAALNSIKELILESNEFVLLLGKIDNFGKRQGGIIEKRRDLLGLKDINNYLQEICESGARKFEFEGKMINAISLYQLSEQYDTVLKLVNELLINGGGGGGEEEEEEEILKIGYNLKNIYEVNVEIRGKIKEVNFNNLNKILNIFEIEKVFKKGKGNVSVLLNEIRDLKLIPIIENEGENLNEIKKLASELNGNNYDECILKLIPKILTLTIDILNETSGNSERRGIITNNLMIFCGLINYKMPREVYSKVTSYANYASGVGGGDHNVSSYI